MRIRLTSSGAPSLPLLPLLPCSLFSPPSPSSRSRKATRFQKMMMVDFSSLRTWPPRASAWR